MAVFFARLGASPALVASVCLLVACGRGSPLPGPASPAEPLKEASGAELASAELELDEDEARIAQALAEHARVLRGHGMRDGEHPWELLESVEYITKQLDDFGLSPERLTTEHDGVIFHSFAVPVRGREDTALPLIVVAAYDSLVPRLASLKSGSLDGIDRGALETGVWLELVRLLGQGTFTRSVRFVLLARHSNQGDAALTELLGAGSGSGVLYLGSGLGARELILCQGGLASGLVDTLSGELPGKPVGASQIESFVAGAERSFRAETASQSEGFPELFVTGRGGGEDFRLAAVRLSAIRRAFGSFLGEKLTNDETVTPFLAAVR